MRNLTPLIAAALTLSLLGCGGSGTGTRTARLIPIPTGFTTGDINSAGTVSLTKPLGAVDGVATLNSRGQLTVLRIVNPGIFTFSYSRINDNGRVLALTSVINSGTPLQTDFDWAGGNEFITGYNKNREFIFTSPNEEGQDIAALYIDLNAVFYTAADFGGGNYLKFIDLNESTQILGFRSPDTLPQNRTYFISTRGSVVDFQKATATVIRAESLNDSAQAAGSALVSGTVYPALWNSAGTITILTQFPNVMFTKLNNRGQYLGKRSPITGPSVWTDPNAEDVLFANGALTSIPSLAPGVNLGRVINLNDQGRILTQNYVLIP